MKPSKNMYNSLKNDPQAIIKWCEEEIEAYKELIKLIKGNVHQKKPN